MSDYGFLSGKKKEVKKNPNYVSTGLEDKSSLTFHQ